MLPEKQKTAVRLLYSEAMKVQDVAALLGVHRGTIWRWKQTKAFRQEWQKVRNAHVRQWRKEMGYDQSGREWNAELHRLEKKVEAEADKIRDGNTKAFDAAWAEYRKHLFSGMANVQKRLKVR